MEFEHVDPHEAPRSQATELFQSDPELRKRIAEMEEFVQFRNSFRTVVVDGETLYVQPGKPMVSGGDVLMDEDQLMLAFAKRRRLI